MCIIVLLFWHLLDELENIGLSIKKVVLSVITRVENEENVPKLVPDINSAIYILF